MPEPKAPDRRLVSVAVVASALLMLAAAAVFYVASSQHAPGDATVDQIIRITASACEPNDLTVSAGERSFEIRNGSDRPIEWEILDGVMVVAERENILPGYTQWLAARLAPGTYAMTCGLLSNPRGTLTVTPSEEWSTAVTQIGLREFLGPLSEYKVYLLQQGTQAVRAVEALADAIAQDDLEQARELWLAARAPYNRIEPMANRFSDLELIIDPVADYLADREADSGFSGFHRIEYGLFAQDSLEGLGPVAADLVEAMQALRVRLADVELNPQLLVDLPRAMATQLANGRVLRDESPYAHSDFAELEANLAGIEKITLLLSDIVAPADPALADDLAERLSEVRQLLARADPGVEASGSATREALASALMALAESLDRLGPALGVA